MEEIKATQIRIIGHTEPYIPHRKPDRHPASVRRGRDSLERQKPFEIERQKRVESELFFSQENTTNSKNNNNEANYCNISSIIVDNVPLKIYKNGLKADSEQSLCFRRAICRKDGETLVIESESPVSLSDFRHALHSYGVQDAF